MVHHQFIDLGMLGWINSFPWLWDEELAGSVSLLACRPCHCYLSELVLQHCHGCLTLCSLQEGVGPVLLLSGPQILGPLTQISRASSAALPRQVQASFPGCFSGYGGHVSSAALTPSGLTHLRPTSNNRVSSSVLPRWGVGPSLPCMADGVGQG